MYDGGTENFQPFQDHPDWTPPYLMKHSFNRFTGINDWMTNSPHLLQWGMALHLLKILSIFDRYLVCCCRELSLSGEELWKGDAVGQGASLLLLFLSERQSAWPWTLTCDVNSLLNHWWAHNSQLKGQGVTLSQRCGVHVGCICGNKKNQRWGGYAITNLLPDICLVGSWLQTPF